MRGLAGTAVVDRAICSVDRASRFIFLFSSCYLLCALGLFFATTIFIYFKFQDMPMTRNKIGGREGATHEFQRIWQFVSDTRERPNTLTPHTPFNPYVREPHPLPGAIVNRKRYGGGEGGSSSATSVFGNPTPSDGWHTKNQRHLSGHLAEHHRWNLLPCRPISRSVGCE